MVHGGGSCSGGGFSGGGGGFSGGGFVHSSTYYSGSRAYGGTGQADCTGCEKCCKGMCACLGVIIYCRGQSLKRRIGMLWGWIAIIIFISSMATLLGRYKPRQREATLSDMIDIHSGLSTVFCKDVKITSTDSQFDAYILNNEPHLGKDLTQYSLNISTYIPDKKYEYWGFYLLKGSTVKIHSCPSQGWSLKLYIIRGIENFEKWKKDNYDSSSYLNYNTPNCMFSSSNVTFKVQESEEYYFVYANHDYRGTSLSATLNLTRTTYDLSNFKQRCKDVRSCQLSYTMGSSETLVVYINSTINSEGDATFQTECIHRSWIFVIVFFIVPVIVGLLISFLLYIKFRKTPTSSLNNREFIHLSEPDEKGHA